MINYARELLKEFSGRPIPMDTPNVVTYSDFKKYAYKNRKMFKKEMLKHDGDSSKMFMTLSALWYKWASKNAKEFTHIKNKLKFGRSLMVMMVKDNLVFDKKKFGKDNNITHVKEQQLSEDGHTDVASAKRKLKLSIEDAKQILQKLESMESEESLPSWWMSKITLASDYLNKCRDYILLPDEKELEEKYNVRSQSCTQSDGDKGSAILYYTDKKGKKHSNCHTSKKKAKGQIAAIEA